MCGGSEEIRKIAWVSWNKVCSPKESRGLGVKHLNIFNIALLGKWKWRFLVDKSAIWLDILKARYGDLDSPTSVASWNSRNSSKW